jgi:hypothetical protein
MMERLIEELLTLHASSPTFRLTFASQQTTQLFIDASKAMIERLTEVLTNGANGSKGHQGSSINAWNVRILEKLNHLGLALALDNAVGSSQKREVFLKILFFVV